MNVALPEYFENLIDRLIKSGRFNNASEVVRAGLRNLEMEERLSGSLRFEPGSLRHLYDNRSNAEERLTRRASSMRVESE
jgi:putative addiction module CopG family antidote